MSGTSGVIVLAGTRKVMKREGEIVVALGSAPPLRIASP